jgi:integrase
MANRTVYRYFGPVFAREPEHQQTPDQARRTLKKVLDGAALRRLIKAAGIRSIKFHGLGHTCATLLLQVGIPAHEVAHRLGLVDATMTLSTHAHATPGRDAEAAARLDAVFARLMILLTVR